MNSTFVESATLATVAYDRNSLESSRLDRSELGCSWPNVLQMWANGGQNPRHFGSMLLSCGQRLRNHPRAQRKNPAITGIYGAFAWRNRWDLNPKFGARGQGETS